jgi:hypothetical protein
MGGVCRNQAREKEQRTEVMYHSNLIIADEQKRSQKRLSSFCLRGGVIPLVVHVFVGLSAYEYRRKWNKEPTCWKA